MTPPVEIPHDIGLLLTLRWALDGGVSAYGPDSFRHNERPIPQLLVPFLRELLDHGQARLDAQGEGQVRRVLLDEAGQALLAELEDNNREIDPPGHGDAHREVGARVTMSGGWSRTVARDDLAGRPRHLEFFMTEKGLPRAEGAARRDRGDHAGELPQVKKVVRPMSTAVPLPAHLRWARARIRAEPGAPGQTSWRFDVIGVGAVWSAEGTVERMVTEINALGCPHDPGDYAPAGPNPGSTA